MVSWYSLAHVALIGSSHSVCVRVCVCACACVCVWAGYCFQVCSQLLCLKAKGVLFGY